MNLLPAAVLAVSFAALYGAHEVGDHWLQTRVQTFAKGGSGWPARLACARHVLVLAAAKAAALLAAFAATGLPARPDRMALALVADAVSHYWADRRTTLKRLASAVGKGEMFDFGTPRPGRDDNPTLGTGAYALDQSWHIGWLFVTALLIAAGAR